MAQMYYSSIWQIPKSKDQIMGNKPMKNIQCRLFFPEKIMPTSSFSNDNCLQVVHVQEQSLCMIYWSGNVGRGGKGKGGDCTKQYFSWRDYVWLTFQFQRKCTHTYTHVDSRVPIIELLESQPHSHKLALGLINGNSLAN